MTQSIEAQRKDLYRYVYPGDAAGISECAYQFMRDEADYDVVYRDRNRKQIDYHIIHATGRHVWKNGMKLAYILYSDESRILHRKQDEGMHWHVETGPFKNDEIEILENGKPDRGMVLLFGVQRIR